MVTLKWHGGESISDYSKCHALGLLMPQPFRGASAACKLQAMLALPERQLTLTAHHLFSLRVQDTVLVSSRHGDEEGGG